MVAFKNKRQGGSCSPCCSTDVPCGGRNLPATGLTLDFSYRTIFVWDRFNAGIQIKEVSCGSRAIVVPLTYTPGTPEKWVSDLIYIEDFPSYQFSYDNTLDYPDQTSPDYYYLPSGCNLTGYYKWELYCISAGWRLFMLAQRINGVLITQDDRFLEVGTYSASPLYARFITGGSPSSCPPNNTTPALCPATFGTTYPYILSSVVT